MSERALRHGAVRTGVIWLAVGAAAWLAILVSVRPAAAQRAPSKEKPPATSKAAKPKPAVPDAAVENPFGSQRDPFDPRATPTKAAVNPAAGKRVSKGAASAAKPEHHEGTIESRGVAVEPGAAEAAIEKALDQVLDTFEFDQVPLADVVAQLAKKLGITILLDTRALNDVSIDPTTTRITMSLRGISLRSALDLMLKGQGLTWMIDREVLVITTPNVVEEHFITRVYDVGDLVRCRDKKGVPWDDYESLISAIEPMIEPDVWHGTCLTNRSISGGSFGNAHVLIVSATRQEHETLAKLLEDLRKVAAKAGPNQPPPIRKKPKQPQPGQGLSPGTMPANPYVG
jgi:hypothetical protein